MRIRKGDIKNKSGIRSSPSNRDIFIGTMKRHLVKVTKEKGGNYKLLKLSNALLYTNITSLWILLGCIDLLF